MQEYGKKGVNIDNLIQNKIASAKKNGRTIDFDTAYEEVVADSMQQMFTDENLGEKLAELKTHDKTLWEKIKDFFIKLYKSIQEVYSGLEPQTQEARLVSEMKDSVEKICDLFAEGIIDAGESFSSTAMEQKNTADNGGVKYSFIGYDEDGKGKYNSNFPKGTPKSAKSERILSYIKNLWSKKPIKLNIKDGNIERTIEAYFDPTYDESGNIKTDASKLMGGNRHGTAAEQRVTLDLADDYYQIASESKYNYSKAETGKSSLTHKNVMQWHYFVNDIYFSEYGSNEYKPYRVSINVKEKPSGNFVYSFSAEQQKEHSTHQTLHADVNNGDNSIANAKLFKDIVSEKDTSVNTIISEKGEKSKEKFSDRDYSYNTLVSKPDMQVTKINDSIQYSPSSQTRKNIIDTAVKNAAKVGYINADGNAVVRVNDIDTDVIISKNGLRHGLDRRLEILAPITLKAGEILKKSIRINELIPRGEKISNSYLLIGICKNQSNEPYVVSFMVNKYTNEITKVNVLYAINAKTESAGSLSPGVPEISDHLTDSTISISNLLDYVNKYFPDILPEDVLRHYGYTERPNGELGKSALYSDRDYSYNALIAKPDMEITNVDMSKVYNRADTVVEAKKNAAKIGIRHKDGSVSVKVKDIDTNVILTTEGLRHGLNRKLNIISPITANIGNILKNSIRVNEMTPKMSSVKSSYVLVGTASDENDLYIVRSIVNSYSNEIEDIDVLYAVSTKREVAATKSPRYTNNNSLSSTTSTISISDLLDYVNKFYPEILSEDVLKYYGHTERPMGNPKELGESMLYSLRNPEATDSRTLLSNAFGEVAHTMVEKEALAKYKSKIEKLNAEQNKLAEIRKEIKDTAFTKGADRSKLTKLTNQANILADRISRADKELLRFEGSKALKEVLEREKANAVKRAKKRSRENFAKYRDDRKSTFVRNKIKTLHGKINTMLNSPTDNSYIPKDLLSAAVDVLSAVDIRNGKTNKTQDALTALYDKYESLKNNPDIDYSSEYDENLATEIQDLKELLGGYGDINKKGTTIKDGFRINYSCAFETGKYL